MSANSNGDCFQKKLSRGKFFENLTNDNFTLKKRKLRQVDGPQRPEFLRFPWKHESLTGFVLW
jgi:hypothetical protein